MGVKKEVTWGVTKKGARLKHTRGESILKCSSTHEYVVPGGDWLEWTPPLTSPPPRCKRCMLTGRRGPSCENCVGTEVTTTAFPTGRWSKMTLSFRLWECKVTMSCSRKFYPLTPKERSSLDRTGMVFGSLHIR